MTTSDLARLHSHLQQQRDKARSLLPIREKETFQMPVGGGSRPPQKMQLAVVCSKVDTLGHESECIFGGTASAVHGSGPENCSQGQTEAC
jgi:hypothetical protein